jgi:predicted transcriptional regulator
MATQTVRISANCHSKLQELARQRKQPMVTVLEDAVEEYRRKQLLDKLSADFARLRKDRKAWDDELKERALWDQTLADGLGNE